VAERYDPWDHGASLGIRVVERRLPGPLLAYWHSPSRTVVLDDGLSHRERRCSLAHELVHVERRDECAQTARVEAAVHLVAARRLISFRHLLAAVPAAGTLQRLADELVVDEPTLEVRLEALTRREQSLLEQATRQVGSALRIA
jgi:hypothetical protein